MGLLSIGVMLASKLLLRWLPLLAVIFAVIIVRSLGLDTKGVAVVGKARRTPFARLARVRPAADHAAGRRMGVALFSYTNAMVVARSFAAENGYEVDANREFFALGGSRLPQRYRERLPSAAPIAHGNESRHGRQESAGGARRGRRDGGGAAVFHWPAELSAHCGFGAVLIVAAIGLFDAHDRSTVAVQPLGIWTGHCHHTGCRRADVLDGILLAVGLALLLVLVRTSRPPDAVLGLRQV